MCRQERALTKKTNVKLVDFDPRQHELVIECRLTFRDYAESSTDFMDRVTADLAACVNNYNERHVEIIKIETARVKEGTPTVTGEKILSGPINSVFDTN